MDSNQWLDFTIVTGIDKFKSELGQLVKSSKKVKNNFEYMRLISTVYTNLEIMLNKVKEIV